MDVQRLIAKYDQRVPRYTSYPTAPHFSSAIDGATYDAWLRWLTDDTALSLYVHVPFCAQLCLFCGCHTVVVRRPEPIAAYARDLLTEIDLLADAIGERLPVRHIHWGGGTPTALPAAGMQAIDQRIRERFAMQADGEVAVEIDPRSLGPASLAALRNIGVTRASLGVQDFDPLVQQAVQRIQPYEMTAECVANLRDIGVRSINLDLMYGLPHQSERGVVATVQQALDLAPDRIAVFGYAHVPWKQRQQALLEQFTLPDGFARFAQRQAAERVIRGAGYQTIGLDHFAVADDTLAIAARAGRLRRNFQGYTADDAPVLLGLGASSIGCLPQGYVQNATAIPDWRAMVRRGVLPVARGIELTEQDLLRREVIERIMCYGAVDLVTVAARHAADAASLMDAAPTLQQMRDDGLVLWDGYRLAVTQRGRPFMRCVAAAFDCYLDSATVRHSVAM